MKITIEGNPIPLQRARAGKSGFYDPQFIAKRNYASIVKEQFKDDPLDIPLAINLIYSIAMPKSWSKKKKIRMIDQPHTQTPDTSNLIKFSEDSLLKILWSDDCIIYKITAEKRWSETGSTIIEF